MRSALGKEVRKQFAQAMSSKFPDYAETKAPSVWPGARMDVHRAPEASYFIRLVPHHNSDKFRVMFGWSSSGAFPDEALRKAATEFDKDLPTHDGCEFCIMRSLGPAGGKVDRWWVLDDPMEVAFDRTIQEFAKLGDTEIDTLERATSDGIGYMLSGCREAPIEKLIPSIPALMEDCMQCLHETVIPYFEKIRELQSQGAT